MMALEEGHVEIAEYLIEQGVFMLAESKFVSILKSIGLYLWWPVSGPSPLHMFFLGRLFCQCAYSASSLVRPLFYSRVR